MLAVTALVAAPLAQAAFVVDQVQVRREGADAVMEVHFATEVQFQRLIATSDGLSVVVAYHLVATTNREVGSGSQVMSLEHLRGLDRLRLTDEAERGENARRLVLQLGTPTRVSARAGRDNRFIELVLAGAGRSLALEPAVPASALSPVAQPPRVPAAGVGVDRATAVDPAVETKAAPLIEAARAAMAAGQPARALDALNPLLNLPPNSATREGQEMAGEALVQLGQNERARAEFETYLLLFPSGEGSERVRARLAALPLAAVRAAAPVDAPQRKDETSIDGSTSMTYYGGNGKLRSQDFLDSPLSGLPERQGDPQFSADKSRQLFNDVDLNWRRRTDEIDQRFVFRDSYTTDLERSFKSRNRLSSLYFDHKSRADGWGARIGRQSPTGGGATGRFDGVQGYKLIAPKVKVGAVIGAPTDRFFDSSRRFAGLSLDADRLIGNLGAGLFAIEQRIDGEVDRRAIGLDLRYFNAGLAVFSQFDYDVAIGGLNVATVQGTYISPDNTVYTGLYDRRTLATLSLGNALTFSDPANPNQLYTRINDRLANTTVEALRDLVKRITPILTQAQIGITKPINAHWQTGASLQLTDTGAIPPVLEVPGFEEGRPATGNIVTASAQLIGLNLYSTRDTHVMALSVIRSTNLDGLVLAYNNSSYVWQDWQLEPSLQYYRDSTPLGNRSQRWTPGLRLTYRGWKRWAIESALTYEIGRATRVSPNPVDAALALSVTERSTRVNYALGVRFEF